MSSIPEWLDNLVDEVIQLGIRKRRPQASWHEPAFNRIEEMVSAGISVREAAKRVYLEQDLKRFTIEEATVRKKYQQWCQKRLADTAADAILADDEKSGAAAIRSLLERKAQDRRK